MVHFLLGIWHWILVATGSLNTSGTQYGFWSGFGSDLAEFGILGGLITAYRHNNCHVKGCPRLGKHSVDGTPYKVCKRHHPDLPEEDITYAHIVEACKPTPTETPAAPPIQVIPAGKLKVKL